MAECALSHWSHLCTCSHKLSWVVRHDVIFKNSIKRYAWKTGYSLFPGSPSSLDLVPGRKQPVKTSAPVSNRSSERAARAPYARGVVKIHRAACACAYKAAVPPPPLWWQCNCSLDILQLLGAGAGSATAGKMGGTSPPQVFSRRVYHQQPSGSR